MGRRRTLVSRLADVAGAIVDLARPLFAPRKPLDLDAIHVGATTEAPPFPRPSPIPRELEMVHLDEPPAGGRFAGTRPPEGMN